MRILIQIDNKCAHYYIRMGLARAMTAMNHDVIMWESDKKPTFDAFDEFSPDMFIGQTFNIDRAIYQCITERPEMKVIMKISDWGNISDNLDRKKYPVVIANEQEKEWVGKLVDQNLIDFGYVHYTSESIKETHNHWVESGVKVESLLSGADIYDFYGGKHVDKFASDVTFVGGYWPYKSATLDQTIMKLTRPNLSINMKIFGNQKWPCPQYYGHIKGDSIKDVFSSAKICPSISELHSQDLGYDIIERPFKLLSNNCFVISDKVKDLETLIPEGIIYTSNDDFVDTVLEWLDKDEERKDIAAKGHEVVMNNHTYFHRVGHIFDLLGISHEATERLEHVKRKIKISTGS